MRFLFVLIILIGSSCTAQQEAFFTNCTVEEYYSTTLLDRASLQELIRTTHRRVLKYTDNDGDDVWKALMDLDAGVDDPDTVHLIYRDLDIPSSLFNTPTGGWNREHLWPQSQGVGGSGADYTDIHHLRPADWGVNAARGNKYFSECLASCKVPATEEAADDTSAGTETWLPPESARGVVARALLYMALRYPDLILNDCPSNDDDIPTMAYLSQLLLWHDMYEPTDQEIARNGKACSRWQGNRNPFVDFPELVPTFFGEPQVAPYTCTGSTQPPPATLASSCSANGLGSGSVMLTQVNADNPDLVAMVVLSNITAGVTLYMTDNAWTGNAQGFRTNEGTVKRSFNTDVMAGTVLSYPDASWESVQGKFSLSAAGDTILLYCKTEETEAIQHISGLSFTSSGWVTSGLNPSDYSTSESALPSNIPAITLDHADNYVYTGSRTGSVLSVQSEIISSTNWRSSNTEGFMLNNTPFQISAGSRMFLHAAIRWTMLLCFGVVMLV